MHPDLAQAVDHAADIAASGRWRALNDRISRCSQTPYIGENWHFLLFNGLCYRIFSDYLHLKSVYETEQRDDSPALAWLARNLLELYVWCTYYASGEENAQRIHEDAGRDGLELLETFSKWGQAENQSTEWRDAWQEMFVGAKAKLAANAAQSGVANLGGRYLSTTDAAKACGIWDKIAVSFKLLSKYTHPTALLIRALPDEATPLLRDIFYTQGCLFFFGGFTCLERYIAGRDNAWMPVAN
jgi:hypothetical protein